VGEMIEPMTVDSIDQRELAEQLVEQAKEQNVDEIVLSLTARGLTTGEIAAHFGEVYGAKISKDTISRITDKVIGEMTEWLNRPLEKVYPVIFIDAMVVKVRDGQVANRPVYVVIGVTVDGERDIFRLWAGDGGEGAKFWLSVFTEIKNRGVQDVCIAVCDGLKGLPETITTTWELATVQACVVHLIRASLKYVPRREREHVARDLKPIYTAKDADQAQAELESFAEKWGQWFPVITQTWLNAWEHVTPFLAFPDEVRRVIYTTNAIEALNRQLRKAIKTKGSFPDRGRRPQARLPRPAKRRPAMDKNPQLDSRAARVQDPLRRPRSQHRKLTVTISLRPE
jgi:putative transposase